MAGVFSPFRQRLRLLISRLAILLVLCLSLGLTACSTASTGITGNYVEDTVAVADSLLATIALAADDPARGEAENQARSLSNGYVARYRPTPWLATTPTTRIAPCPMPSRSGSPRS
jgi:photosystem II Psb27 protein